MFCDQILALLFIIANQILFFSVTSDVANEYFGWIKIQESQEHCALRSHCEWCVKLYLSLFVFLIFCMNSTKNILPKCASTNKILPTVIHLLLALSVNHFSTIWTISVLFLVHPQTKERNNCFSWRKSTEEKWLWSKNTHNTLWLQLQCKKQIKQAVWEECWSLINIKKSLSNQCH